MESNKGESVNLWNELLAKTIKLENKDPHILVLGNFDSGKKSLIAAVEKLMGDKVIIESRNEQSVMFTMKDKKNPGAFDYSYVSIRSSVDESYELAKVNFWALSEKLNDDVLKQLLTKERLQNFAVMILLDFEKLSTLPDDLMKWMTYVNQKITPAFRVFNLKEMDTMRNKLADWVMNYTEPVKTEEGKILNRKIDVNPELADKLIIPNGVLQPNYGFPLFICMSKADYILELRKERYPEEILEMLEYTLRKTATPYGASVIYTSSKMGTNVNVLAGYIKYLFFGMPFGYGYNSAKDSVFVPIGYDNPEIINTAFDSISKKIYSDVIPKKEESANQQAIEFKVRPHQAFLQELRTLQPVTAARQDKPQAEPRARNNFTEEHRRRIMRVLNQNQNQGNSQAAGNAGTEQQPPAQPDKNDTSALSESTVTTTTENGAMETPKEGEQAS